MNAPNPPAPQGGAQTASSSSASLQPNPAEGLAKKLGPAVVPPPSEAAAPVASPQTLRANPTAARPAPAAVATSVAAEKVSSAVTRLFSALPMHSPAPQRPDQRPDQPNRDKAAPARIGGGGVPQVINRFALRLRHMWQMASFVLVVVIPTLLSGLYLYLIADDQYTSSVGFAVRSEEISSALAMLGGLSSLSGTSSSADTDILYRFIQSQELVQQVDSELDLRQIYSKPSFDPVFTVNPQASIEQLTSYWQDMVHVFYDNGTGLIELRVHAFTPTDATAIAQAIFDDSSAMINALSDAARADATRYAREELEQATDRLSKARVALTQFRSRTQIIDPSADIQGQMGLLSTLQQQQASAMIELSLMRETARPDDPRIDQGERRIAVIEQMIAAERRKLGVGSGGSTPGEDLSSVVGEYERLTVEREFSERAYLAALTTYDNAQAEAQRKSRYLAAYTGPTLAQDALYPQRGLKTSLVFAFALLLWGIGLLVYYSIRDRR